MYDSEMVDNITSFFTSLSINLVDNPGHINSSQFLYSLKYTEFALKALSDQNNIINMTEYFFEFKANFNYLGGTQSFNVNNIELFRGCRINLHSNMDFIRMNEEIMNSRPNNNQF